MYLPATLILVLNGVFLNPLSEFLNESATNVNSPLANFLPATAVFSKIILPPFMANTSSILELIILLPTPDFNRLGITTLFVANINAVFHANVFVPDSFAVLVISYCSSLLGALSFFL